MEIRPADAADVEAIRDVARASWEADYPDIVSRETAADAVEEWYGTDRVRAAVEESGTVLLVATADRDGEDGGDPDGGDRDGGDGDSGEAPESGGRDGDDVVGFAHATVSTENWTGAILRLYVHPENRRAGIGSTLLEATVRRLFDRGVDRVEAMVLADNDLGNRFYQEGGFERRDTHETRVGDQFYDEHRYVYAGTD